MIRKLILRWARNRKPDFVIGGQESPYLRRHWLIPRNRFFNVYVHEFLRSDDDRALHDHPWAWNASWLIEGGYIEHTPGGRISIRSAGEFAFRRGPAPHRVELFVDIVGDESATDSLGLRSVDVPCWTVFITGPIVREWGFHCPKRWVPWKEFVDARDAGAIGKGCAE